MMALLDLSLFAIDVRSWQESRANCIASIEAIELHDQHLREQPIRLLWSDDFLDSFPWNQQDCPRELRDSCTALLTLYEHLRSNGRLVLLDNIDIPESDFLIEPSSLLDGFQQDLRLAWSWLFAWATSESHVGEGVAVPTRPRAALQNAREARVSSDDVFFSSHGSAVLLFRDSDWTHFVQTYKRPNLQGKRIAVLGGSRAPFERARKQLEAYGVHMHDMRRLPLAYEETRTKQETLDRLKNADLLLVCTNRCKHTDTDHVDGPLSCARVDLNSDGHTALVDAVIRHFRDQ